jgi:hypothetical protein
MKQTAVDWLEMEILKLEKDFAIRGKIYKLCKQAKEMEKEQIVNANINGQLIYSCQSEKAKQYYNETYKSK